MSRDRLIELGERLGLSPTEAMVVTTLPEWHR
jgi:hypothetical protein